ncbi:hypothetical protein [Hydrogenimonas cancrithermarum]|uniref:Uncharacterized protein n=1 Tax=Hydrogenimonas cancrithermarum TaxID=2993563 RepID=A0ABM8FHW3_9BACT|nr:hypothetical protein [Hydrogenimonas cancrithermarum]BDY11880.1 hypothetical protein HCR_01920 [Hydrogenimonas cancrithermarum]
MKKLKREQTAQLMQIISTHYPNQQILHLTDGSNDLHKALYDFTKAKGFEYDLRTVASDLDEWQSEDHPGFHLEPLDLAARQYNKHAKKYENIFVTLAPAILESDPETMFKKFFRIMKNAATVAILVEKGTPMQEEIDKKLEESYFVAINHIDIFDDYDVVTAKKMHGWGAYSVGF